MFLSTGSHNFLFTKKLIRIRKMKIVQKIKRNAGSYRAILTTAAGTLCVEDLKECTGGYEAFLSFAEYGMRAIEYRRYNKSKWETVYAVEDGNLMICDEDIFTQLTVKDVKDILYKHKDIQSTGKAFKIYDLVTLN